MCIYCRPASETEDNARECNICGAKHRIPTEALRRRHALERIEEERQRRASDTYRENHRREWGW